MTEPQPAGRATERGSAVVEFVLVAVVAVVLALALAQLGLFLWERNALMGSLSEGARVAATEGPNPVAGIKPDASTVDVLSSPTTRGSGLRSTSRPRAHAASASPSGARRRAARW